MNISNSVLTVNTGSSSIKLALLSPDDSGSIFEPTYELSVDNIGQTAVAVTTKKAGSEAEKSQPPISDYLSAIVFAIQQLIQATGTMKIAAIGHRVVHGGPKYSSAQLINDELVGELKALTAIDQEHMPAALDFITSLRERFPDVPQVACFDTAFFHDLPRNAQIIPLPRKFEAAGLRRYGFHGLSYTYLLSKFQDIAGETAANGKIIIAHLGSGASLTAIKNQWPVDTTMGFTPASGIIMSSRSGDLDPGIGPFLYENFKVSPEEFNRLINTQSGLLGVSELSADMYTLLQAEATDPKAAEAIELFCYDIRKAIGALAATMGGVNSLIFSGGIGTQSSAIRSRICSELGFLGIELDPTSNDQHAELISTVSSSVGVHVIPTNEAQVICKQTIRTVTNQSKVGEL